MSVAVFFVVPLVALAVLVPLGRVLARRHPESIRWSILVTAFLVGLWLDIASKDLAFERLPGDRDTIAVSSWFSWTHAENPGAAFGMFRGKHDFFMVVTLLAFVGVPYFVHAARERVRLTALVFGLILAGVAGNFWDRMTLGVVRDFIDVHTPSSGALYDLTMRAFGTNIWPTFNVADIFITCGAVVALLFLGHADEEEEETTAPGGPDAAAATPEATPPDAAPTEGEAAPTPA